MFEPLSAEPGAEPVHARPAANDAPLFRTEALDAQRGARHGGIVLLPSASSRGVAWASLALVLALAALVMWGSYTRRSTVSGQLLPSEGLIRVAAPQTALVVERSAVDGQQVRRGQVLFVLSADRQGPDAQDYQRGIAAQIEQRRLGLEAELRRLALAESQELALLRRRGDSVRGESAQVQAQERLLSARVRGADDARNRYADLLRQGYASRDEWQAREAEAQEARGRLEAHRRDALALNRELGNTQREAEALQNRYASQRADIERAILLAAQEHTELEARRRIVVAAPADGRLTLVQAEVGQTVEPALALAQLEPASSRLVARLYAPSRAAGSVKPGASVLLRYDAFPYQKYGQHAGRVAGISTAAVAPAELSGAVAGGAPGLSARGDGANEPLFAVTVALPAQQIGLPGQQQPLRAGMRVEADLLHESRPLYEWILEPLYAARVRLHGEGSP